MTFFRLLQYDKEVILFMTQDFVSITLSTGIVSRCLSTQFSLCLTPALSGLLTKIGLAQLKYQNLANYSRFDLLTLELAVMGDNCVHDRYRNTSYFSILVHHRFTTGSEMQSLSTSDQPPVNIESLHKTSKCFSTVRILLVDPSDRLTSTLNLCVKHPNIFTNILN